MALNSKAADHSLTCWLPIKLGILVSLQQPLASCLCAIQFSSLSGFVQDMNLTLRFSIRVTQGFGCYNTPSAAFIPRVICVLICYNKLAKRNNVSIFGPLTGLIAGMLKIRMLRWLVVSACLSAFLWQSLCSFPFHFPGIFLLLLPSGFYLDFCI